MIKETCALASIDAELSRIWESLEGSQKTWASLFNIVFYSKSNPEQGEYRWLLDMISKKFPCRSIFIYEEESSKDHLCVRVSAETLGEGEMSVVCDQIFIDASGCEREKVPYLVLPHLLPDLPIYGIWTEEPDDRDPILHLLKQYASKIIYDSAICSSLQTFSNSLLKQATEHPNTSISDLSWILTSGWRELFSRTFNTPKRIDELYKAHVIRIGYNKGPEGCMADQNPAIYLQGWIAAQLNWKFNDIERIEGNVRISYSRFLYNTIVLLTPESVPDLPQGAITSVEIETADHNSHFLFKRSAELKMVKVWISSADRCDIPYQIFFTQAGMEQMFLRELFHKGINSQYRNLLALLQEMG